MTETARLKWITDAVAGAEKGTSQEAHAPPASPLHPNETGQLRPELLAAQRVRSKAGTGPVVTTEPLATEVKLRTKAWADITDDVDDGYDHRDADGGSGGAVSPPPAGAAVTIPPKAETWADGTPRRPKKKLGKSVSSMLAKK